MATNPNAFDCNQCVHVGRHLANFGKRRIKLQHFKQIISTLFGRATSVLITSYVGTELSLVDTLNDGRRMFQTSTFCKVTKVLSLLRTLACGHGNGLVR